VPALISIFWVVPSGIVNCPRRSFMKMATPAGWECMTDFSFGP
jgi:hypothetical protein